MYFFNRGSSSFLLLAIVILIFLFFNFLPYILLIGAVILAVRYSYKKIKQFDFKSGPKVKMNKSTFNKGKEEDFNNANVIDVEYTEVK